MMADSVSPLAHQKFALIYSPADWGNDSERARRRWAGVTTLANDPGNDEIETWIRLAFKSRQTPTSQQLHSVRQAFTKADDGFDLQGNDRELQVLAASALVTLFEHGSDAASA